ncbi:hypothetical protein BDA96_09G113800 [Sorghum bicolor]|uniref:Uncharacterized protein n=1 Tax=Sorghum bicolor TaxID=4558 RepID=A0A921QC75_SORBI|nr:hypothetical protein BDA96_09G113800 [Sorghum bicolor]
MDACQHNKNRWQGLQLPETRMYLSFTSVDIRSKT